MDASDSQTVPESSSDTVPQASQQFPRWIWWLLLAVLLVGGGGFAIWNFLKPKATAPAKPRSQSVPISVQTIQSDKVESSSEFVGTLEAQERVSLQPQIQGRIDRVFVKSGDRVTQGEPIVSLSIDQAKAQVISAVAGANSSRAALATAQAQLESAQATQAKAAADVRLQRTQFNRTQQLVTEGAQAKQQLDIAQNNLDTSVASLDAAQKQVNAAKASIEQAKSNLQQSKANIASVQVNLNYKQVLAPISGVVGDFPVKEGDYVNIGQTLTSIIKNDELDMRISVPSNYAAQLRSGLPVELLDVNTGDRLTTGQINFISPQVNTGVQGILIKARFANSQNKLRDGQYVRAKIVWNQHQGLLVPTLAISRIGGQNFVFLVENSTSGKPQQVHQQPVKLGEVQGDRYQVIQGVKSGDRIAISNILKLRDGTPVEPQ
ncbi:efflux RND transporter periplasmic adaptor subunit [Calothrix sp. PCC 7507]|uniref:efflux RND transporter periplasmic adaptor subunit n=1 Tax=Calothrix sp. PCC 7507 TaxID=99598 RepID=UPI00029F2A3A|nr:efflux RND transporter periplasmic adaptor subunit [Calothrix sp. PCC 7507]AFY34062.1 efflux transporter, RND family, MFP subunit [Calothrix sp. PCC 7507]